MLKLKKDLCDRYEISSTREWLETNGIGGYASASVAGANTRRYHGLLIAATRPPLGRVVLLSKFEETLLVDGVPYDLSCNKYPGTVHRQGCKFLTGFRLDPFPVWTYKAGGVEIERSLFMVHGENSTVLGWRLKNARSISPGRYLLEVKPLLAFRDHHHLRHTDGAFGDTYVDGEGIVSITPYPYMPTLHLAHNAKGIERQADWYRNFEYEIEIERGFDNHEDLFQPFSLTFDMTADAIVIASTEKREAVEAATLEHAEKERRNALIDVAGFADDFSQHLVRAADQFIVSRGAGKTVLAGYPWFSDWGRDTMIALNGLTLVTGRPEVARSVLTEFSRHISEGMLPNRFPDAGETPEYNTVDATLWYFEAIRAYAARFGDHPWVRDELYEKLVDIIEWHVRGTRYGIHVDFDGLLHAGEPGVQLTWMDAKVGDLVITPRTGKPVEIEALWYNALCTMAELAAAFGDDVREKNYREMAVVARSSFNGQFWNEDESCLFDVVTGAEKDGSVRPNQVFAVSLHHSMLEADEARRVVDKVERELLTPVGLRSLSPNDPRYVGIYIGSPLERDSAYHQGTVWGWLIGPYIDAYKKVHSRTKTAGQIKKVIAGFKTHLGDAVIGQVSEIFDGDPPHKPRGCGAQAWSVAEVLRIVSQK